MTDFVPKSPGDRPVQGIIIEGSRVREGEGLILRGYEGDNMEYVMEKCLRGGGQSGCQKSRTVREGEGLFVSYMQVDEVEGVL